MTKNISKIVLSLLMMLVVIPASAAFKDFKIDLTAYNDPSSLLTADEVSNSSNFEFGIAVADDGTLSRVEATDASATAVISGKYHNDHGCTNVKLVVPVEGPVKIGIGNCTYASHTIKVTNSESQEVASFATATGCWSRSKNDETMTFGYYNGAATTLTIVASSYTPAISIQAISAEDIPSNMTVSYSIGESGAEGVVPAGFEVEGGKTFTIPVNSTLFIEGKTLTGWTDGTNTYTIGQEVPSVANTEMTLTPVFTENTVALADRTEATTIKWNFRRDQGATAVGFQNNSGFYVAQANVNGSVIDVKMVIDATSGKFNNQNHMDWCQVNSGTKFIIPSCKGAIVSLESMNATTTSTIEGSTEYTADGGIVSYTVKGTSETVEVVIGDGSWYRSASVVLPVAAEEETSSNFKDFEINLYTTSLLTDEEKVQGVTFEFGVIVDAEGNQSRTTADDANANFVLKGKFHNDHGWLAFSSSVKVDGPVLISLGTCQYGGGDVTVKNADGDVVLEMNSNNGTCYSAGNEATIVSDYYRGGATTLTIQSNNYTPYFAVKAVSEEDLPEASAEGTITFDLGESGAEGTAPTAIKGKVGETITIPANTTLFVEGKTLTGWTDGTNTYNVGTEFTIAADANLTPVFTENTVTLADRTSEVTLNWFLGEKNGAPALNSGTGFIVTQGTVNGTAIDVKMIYDATKGKLYNLGRGDVWAQVNSGTIFTIPSCKNAVVSMNAYNAITTTTIDGQSDYSSGNDISYTVANTAETIDIVIGDGSYYSYIKVVLPVDESSAPIIEERAIINTDFTSWESVGSSGGSVDITTNFSNENIKFTLNGTSLNPAGTNSGKFGDAIIGWVMAEKNKSGEVITSTFKNITKVRYFHGATGSNRGWAFQKKSANDANWVTLSTDIANPAAGVWVEKEINEENVQLRWYNLADAQNAYMFNLEVYANVEITAKQVALTTAVSPEEAAGSINVYPASPSYDEGSEITLTATENFGYNFVNWTNSAGEEVSTEAKFKYIINADETLTANFVKVNTYELAVAVEGGANDYMISFNPAPEIIDGKNMYEEGTVVEMTASSNAILTFTNWDTGETGGIKIVTMDDNKSFTASYSAADYIVGWDFIRRGNDGRAADFASTTDNEATVLYMTNAEGKTKGWLDKSKEAAGGYESFVGAAVNWAAIADKYYYETKINASEFTNIKVQAEMMYNYNAYQTQKIEYSIDGQNWTEAGRMTMPAVKTECPIEATLGADANNSDALYIRFIPDYTSNIDGTTSDNDGTTITNIFIFGEKQLINDGKAPVLVSSVPAEGATGASATGKIVLNFDEKVKLTANAKATISGEAVEGTVTGKTITFAYTGLEYNTQYVFTLDGGSVADLTDNAIAEAITINFTTMDKPTINKSMYDVVVTNVDEFKAALNKADGKQRFRIFLHNGTYDLGSACLTNVPGNISLIGESTEGTIIMNKAPNEGISISATLCTGGENIYMQDLTVKNAGDYDASAFAGRFVAIQENASKAVYKNVTLLSNQDTYYTRATKRTYWEGGMITGTVDYICGGGDIFFNGVTLYNNARSNGDCITAPATSSSWGYVFSNCTIDGDEGQDGRYSLGRPWQGSPRAVYINTTMKILPTAAGWSDMGVLPGLFAEYNSHTENGTPVDCSKRKTNFLADKDNNIYKDVTYNPVLTPAEAIQYTIENVLGGDDNWQPQLLTEQAPVPSNVSLDKATNIMTWNYSDYALLWAVCKDGKVVAFTTEPTYTVDDVTATWSVRAANEMGGLGEAAEATLSDATGIESINNNCNVVSTSYYNLNGVKVSKSFKGTVIKIETLNDGKQISTKVVR